MIVQLSLKESLFFINETDLLAFCTHFLAPGLRAVLLRVLDAGTLLFAADLEFVCVVDCFCSGWLVACSIIPRL